MINNASSVDNTQDSSYQCGHSDVAHSEPLRENAAKTDLASLLAAAPLAEALRVIVDSSDIPYMPDNEYARGMICASQIDADTARKALTQSEALIKQSEAVWAVVEAAKDYKNNHPHEAKRRCLFDMVRRLEALEMMEKGQ